MSRIHYFNPGHETAILQGTRNYTPPSNVRKMQKDLAILPVWYAEPEDLVYIPEIIPPGFLYSQPKELQPLPALITEASLANYSANSSLLRASPWGISPQSLHLFNKLKESTGIPISIPEWKEEYTRLTGRQTAADCLRKIRAYLPDLAIPAPPCFCTSTQEVEEQMLLWDAPFVLKTPFSSSGRGLLWIWEKTLDAKDKNWINGAIHKQGTVSIESGLEKIQDFAMEFHSDGQGHVGYEGLSVFNTEERGAYSGNVMECQAIMRTRITQFTGEEAFRRIQETVACVLSEIYGSIYTGYLGVDMLVYKQKDGSFAIHPCVEINMRYTMGMVALRLFQKYIAPEACGNFRISFDKEEGGAYEKDCQMRDSYPLQFTEGKIGAGYLSLCPVGKETHYRAYLLIL